MSEQALDLRRSLRILWRHKIIVGIITALGLSAGIAFTILRPPLLTSQALVALPSSKYIGTKVFVAGSNPVLINAGHRLDPPLSLQELRDRVQVKNPTPTIVSISAQGKTAAQAEGIANTVASSYIAYLRSANSPGVQTLATVLQPATTATGTPLRRRFIVNGGLGAVIGLLIGSIFVLATGRKDRRLRVRDEIADSIGVPVLMSISVSHPSDAAGWARLFEDYQPGAVDEWRLRKTLRQLGLTGVSHTDLSVGSGSSLAVLSLSSDPKALALGPQLAIFAASLGIPTALVVGPQQDVNATAMLRAACAAPQKPSGRSRNLLVTVSDHHNADPLPGAKLTVVVSVVDGQTPQVADTMRATRTALGVSAGVATAEQLARVAASAAADGRDLAGVLVADPEPDDHTTGRVPDLTRPTHRRMPTRMTDISTDTGTRTTRR
jgi:capsular polysaccharide biosynthesis protein